MASTDKTLGRLSVWASVVLLVGLTALPFLPARHAAPVKPRAPETRSGAPADTPAKQTTPEAAAAPNKSAAVEPAPEGAAPAPEVWSEAEIAGGLRECLALLAPVAADITLEEPVRKGACGTPAPVLLHSIGTGAKVSFDPPPQMNCRLAAGLARWVDAVLQPAAREVLGSRVTRIIGASSYSCRNVYNNPNLSLSEHATGNAVDIGGFVTADGRAIKIGKGWGPTERDIAEAKRKIAEAAKSGAKPETKSGAKPEDAKKAAEKEKSGETQLGTDGEGPATKPTETKPGSTKDLHRAGFRTPKSTPVVTSLSAAQTREAAFLKRLHSGACTVFGTVLGPEANEAHRDHFHFDMKERRGRGVCH